MMADATKTLWFDELDSTNAEARRRAEAGETGDLWIAARRQTEGRGRRGRVWESPPGNLHATLLTTTDKPPAEAAQLSFVAALAVADLCDAYAPESLVKLKWPNDVLIDGRKVAGILIESGVQVPHPRRGGGGPRSGGRGSRIDDAGELSLTPKVQNADSARFDTPPPPRPAVPLPRFAGEEPRLWLAVGVGVNLVATPRAPERAATSLAEHPLADGAAPPTPEAALESLAATFACWRAVWDRDGFAPIRAAWTERAYGLGQRCTARLASESLEGMAEELDVNGALVLRLPNSDARRITAGDVFFS